MSKAYKIKSITEIITGKIKIYFLLIFLQHSPKTKHNPIETSEAGRNTKSVTIIPPKALALTKITVYTPKNSPLKNTNTRVTYLNFVKTQIKRKM